MADRILLLPGDGIGPEVTEQARRALVAAAERAGIGLAFENALIGGCSLDAHGTALSDEALELARSCRAVLLGAVGGPKWDGQGGERPEAGLLRIRKELGLFANLRPATVYAALADASALRAEVVSGVDLLVVRELTGGIYYGESGRRDAEGVRRAFNTMEYDEHEIARITRVACDAALGRSRKVTHVHKANVLEVSRLWVEVVDEVVAKEYPDITLEHQLVDSMAMLLVSSPKDYDVIVTGNLFGDILSDEAAEITGSLGMLPSASLGEGGVGLYEPVHGSAPDIAGQDKANPLAAILSAAMLLEHTFKATEAAGWIRDAVAAVLEEGHRTGDLQGQGTAGKVLGCTEMGDLVLGKITGR